MVDYNLIHSIGVSDEEVESLLREAFGEDVASGKMDSLLKTDIS
jgi:hypothetical protein